MVLSDCVRVKPEWNGTSAVQPSCSRASEAEAEADTRPERSHSLRIRNAPRSQHAVGVACGSICACVAASRGGGGSCRSIGLFGCSQLHDAATSHASRDARTQRRLHTKSTMEAHRRYCHGGWRDRRCVDAHVFNSGRSPADQPHQATHSHIEYKRPRNQSQQDSRTVSGLAYLLHAVSGCMRHHVASATRSRSCFSRLSS